MPPLACPPPEPECPLYEQRSEDATLRRLIFMERRRVPDLPALIRVEAGTVMPPRAALPPAPEPVPLSILDQLKENPHE